MSTTLQKNTGTLTSTNQQLTCMTDVSENMGCLSSGVVLGWQEMGEKVPFFFVAPFGLTHLGTVYKGAYQFTKFS